jgi:hypothetical protein
MVMTMDDSDNAHPWRIYGKEHKVSESKMGKSDAEKGYPLPTSSGEGSKVTSGGATLHLDRPKTKKEEKKFPISLGTAPNKPVDKATVPLDVDKERSMSKSVELLEAMHKSVSPNLEETGIDLLKACKACMDKGAEGEKKAYLGSLGPDVKFKPGTGGTRQPGSKPVEMKQKPGTPPPLPSEALGGAKQKVQKSDEDVDKALTAMSIPRLPRAMQKEMIRRNAQSVMTRGNSKFAKDIHTGPLTGEVVQDVEEDAARRTGRFEVFKACGGCGRRYKLYKGVDSGCPTCQINKSTHCDACGSQLVKSHGGRAHCPLCG